MALSGFLSKGHLPQVSRQSGLSANDMGDNEIDDYGQISRDLPYDYGHANVDSRGNLMLFT